MDVAFGQLHGYPDAERLLFAKQLGVNNVIVHTPNLPGDGFWELEGLVKMRELVEGHGL